MRTTVVGLVLLSLAAAACSSGAASRPAGARYVASPASPPARTVAAVSPAPLAPPARRSLNATCPVLVGNPVDPQITTQWNGRTVAFCSPSARVMWEADPSRYASNLPPTTSTASLLGTSSLPAAAAIAPAARPVAPVVRAAAPAPLAPAVLATTPPCRVPAPAANVVKLSSPGSASSIGGAHAAPSLDGECDECPGGVCRIPGR
jgi:hypothetical protein